jgi:glycosyltransferase involved in cell wall biosynthesis
MSFFARMLDMVITIFRYKKANYCLIDTYSSKNFYLSLLASFCCRLIKIKYIPILHGGNLPHRLDNSPFLSKLLFKKSHLNVSPSAYLEYEFRKRGYNNIVLIPNNINISDYIFTPRNVIRPYLLWVRAFDKIYNCEMAVHVLKTLKSTYPNTKLCMVGPDKDGTLKNVIKEAQRANLTISNDVTKYTDFDLLLPGKLSKPDWHNLSQEYDIFISTTNIDNTPVSVIESMALGLPVISTNVGGVPYLINDGIDGFLVEKNSVLEMCSKIKDLLENRVSVQAIAKQARAKVEQFGWEVVKEKWLEVLK